jgi:ribose transport system permease protein
MTPTTHSTGPEMKDAPRSYLKMFSRLEVRMLGLALVVAITLSILSPYFLKAANLLNLLDQSVVVGIVAIGMTFVILTGGIDLSVGSVAGLTVSIGVGLGPLIGIQ